MKTEINKKGFGLYSKTMLPTRQGIFQLRIYRQDLALAGGPEIMAIVSGDVSGREGVPVRVHSACFTAETLGSLKCDCREQLEFAMDYIAQNIGVVIYLPQEGRGIGLGDKIRAYALQEEGHDTVDANDLLGLPHDARTYEDAALVLAELQIRSIRLITNNPEKIRALQELGVLLEGRIPVIVPANPHSSHYLATKRSRMGHLLEDP